MAYLLTNLLQDAYRSLGRTATFLATGGSATTVVCTTLKEKYREEDMDDFALFISRTTDELSPQGKFGLVTSYVKSTYTITIPTVTDTVSAGDEFVLVDSKFPLQEMIRLANKALSSLGDLVLTDTSLTTTANTYEYNIPVAAKREKPIKIQVEYDDDRWHTLDPSSYEIVPIVGGTAGLLIFRDELDAGDTIKIWYRGVHPTLNAWGGIVSEYINPELATSALVLQALIWSNSQIDGGSEYWLQKQDIAQREYEIALQRYPIWKPARMNSLLTLGYTRGQRDVEEV